MKVFGICCVIFGDDSIMGDLICIKIGMNLCQFGGVIGNGVYQWYCDENYCLNFGIEGDFYNWGWWDMWFDEFVFCIDWFVVEVMFFEGGL